MEAMPTMPFQESKKSPTHYQSRNQIGKSHQTSELLNLPNYRIDSGIARNIESIRQLSNRTSPKIPLIESG